MQDYKRSSASCEQAGNCAQKETPTAAMFSTGSLELTLQHRIEQIFLIVSYPTLPMSEISPFVNPDSHSLEPSSCKMPTIHLYLCEVLKQVVEENPHHVLVQI